MLRADGGAELRIRVVGRMHPGATDFWDGNWLVSPIDLVVGGFTGRAAAGLRSEELLRLREGLEMLYESLEGEATLESMEDWLHLTCRGDGRGHVEVLGTLVDQPGVGNKLTFSLQTDQSFLPELIASLRKVESSYPVMGRP